MNGEMFMQSISGEQTLRAPGLVQTALLTIRYRSPVAGRGRALIPHLILLAAPILLSAVTLWQDPGVSGLEILQTMASSYYMQFAVGVVMLGIGLGGFPVEDSYGTMVFLLTKPCSRIGILLGRILSACVTGAGLVILSLTATGLLLKAPVANIVKLWPGLATAAVIYGTLFTVLPLATKRTTVIGLIYLFIWEGIVSFVPGAVNSLTVSVYLRSLMPPPASVSGAPDFLALFSNTSHSVAYLRLGIWWVFIFAAGIMLFRSRQYSITESRSDAEA